MKNTTTLHKILTVTSPVALLLLAAVPASAGEDMEPTGLDRYANQVMTSRNAAQEEASRAWQTSQDAFDSFSKMEEAHRRGEITPELLEAERQKAIELGSLSDDAHSRLSKLKQQALDAFFAQQSANDRRAEEARKKSQEQSPT